MIPYGKQYIDDEDIAAVVAVLKSDFLTQGPRIEAFESAFAKYVNVKYAVAVSNGTAALHIAALAAGVGPGNALITSPITFVASANAALYAGGRVVFCDVDPVTVNMDPTALEAALRVNPDVRAIVPVHFAGLPCDMKAIKAAADRAGAVIIEDAAHALGGVYADGTMVGSCSHSLMTIFSFHPVKAIAAGEGGLITTNDEATYRRLLRLRSHGINKMNDAFLVPEQAITDGVANPWYYEMREIGFNYRITDIQCALAASQLKKIDRFLARRRQLARSYDKAFEGLNNSRPAQPFDRDRSGLHLYVMRFDFDAIGMNRAQFMLKLREANIGSQVHYIPVPAQPHYRSLGFRPEDYPAALAFYHEALSIPLYYGLDDATQHKVIKTIKELVG
jgi:UDP-4-amino-4,6-dideoxy-N-acetyl-beta-L-altrosamine transaminase